MPRPDRRLLRESAAARRHIGLAVALGVLGALLVVAQAALLASIVADVFLGGAGLAEVRGRLIALAAAVAARALVAWGFEVSGRLGAIGVMSDLRARLVSHLVHARPMGLDGERSGELAATAVQGVDALDAYFSRYLPAVALAGLVPLAVLAAVVPVDRTSAAVMLVTVPLIPVFMVLVGLLARDRIAARWRTLGLLSAHLLDVLRGLPTLRAHGRVGAQLATLGAVGERYRRETMATLRVAFLSALVLELLAMLGTALVAVTVGVRLASGGMSFEPALFALLLAPEVYAPLRQLGAEYHAGAEGATASGRIFEVLDEPAALRGSGGAAPPPDPRTAPIAFEQVSFRYPGRGGAVLDGLELTIAPGERVGLVGGNGSGKSTLAALLLRLADPSAGRVTVGGADLAELDPSAWRARLAWVPQRPHLFAASLRDNIRLGAPDADDAAVLRAARDARIEDLVAALPEGLDTRVGDGGRRVSAGERRRIAIARALLRDASLVVLDEPTADLDPESTALIADAVERLLRGRSALVIAHNERTLAAVDRVVAIDGGRIAGASPSPRRAIGPTLAAVGP